METEADELNGVAKALLVENNDALAFERLSFPFRHGQFQGALGGAVKDPARFIEFPAGQEIAALEQEGRLVVARMVALRVEREGGVEAGQSLVEAADLLFRQRPPDQGFEIIRAKRQRPLIAGDGVLRALRRHHQIAAIVPGLRRARIGANGGVESCPRLCVAGERQQRRAAIVQRAGMPRLARQRAVIGGDGLLQPLKALQEIAAIHVGVAKKGIETGRLVEKFERAVAMAEIAQNEGARAQGLRIGRIEPQGGVIGGDRLIEPSRGA